MAFITISNANRIIKKSDFYNQKINGDFYDIYKIPINFLGKSEVNYLFWMHLFLEDTEEFVKIYQPATIIQKEDSYKYVYESVLLPSYHEDQLCIRLNSKYKNFEIPFEIIVSAEEYEKINKIDSDECVKKQVQKFRSWFKQNAEFYNNNPKEFVHILDRDWNVRREMIELERDNSGIDEIENFDLKKLENEIDKIILEAGKFFINSDVRQKEIIRSFQSRTFLAYKHEEINPNYTGLSDLELKEFLKKYNQTFKKPLIYLLIEYYKVKFNPNLSFEGKLLERLNFRPCSLCCEVEKNNFATVSLPQLVTNEDLPF